MPLCPIQGPYKNYAKTCHFNPNFEPITTYETRHCHYRESTPAYTMTDIFFTQNDDQYIGMNAQAGTVGSPEGTCTWCDCDTQIDFKLSQSQIDDCGLFDTDCDGLIWSDWGECKVTHADATCGMGMRERLRKFTAGGSSVSAEETEAMCYNPRVRREWAESDKMAMKNNGDAKWK